MSGNVAEWTSKVTTMGGYYDDNNIYCVPFYARVLDDPGFRVRLLGFRVVRTK